MEKKVSIIIPVYNVEKFVEKCLESTIKQTYTNLEILVVIGKSTDSSTMICEKIASKDNRIHLIPEKESGLSGARNTALDIMTGDFVTFLDGDDWLEPDAVENMINPILELEKGNCAL